MINVILSAVNAGLSMKATFDAAERKREIYRETARRSRYEFERTVSATRAAGGASGILSDSAQLTNYVDKMREEFDRQEEWNRRSVFEETKAMETAAPISAWAEIFGSAMSNYGGKR